MQSRCQCWQYIQQTGRFIDYRARWYVSRPSEDPRHPHPSLQPSVPFPTPERPIPASFITQLRPVPTMVRGKVDEGV